MGALTVVAGEPDRLRHADRRGCQHGRHRGGMDPGLRGLLAQIQLQQAGPCAAVAGHRHGPALEGGESGQVIEGLVHGFDASIQSQALQLPAALAADRCQQVLPIPGGGAHAIDPLRHRGLRRHRPGALPGRCPRLLQHQVPPATAVLRHQQPPVRQPLGLEHGGGVSAGQAAGSGQLTCFAERRPPHPAAVPGHRRLLPFHPGQLSAIGAEDGIAGEVRRLVQQLRLLMAAVERDLHQLVTSCHLPDPEPATAAKIQQSVGQIPLPRQRQPQGLHHGGCSPGAVGQVPVLLPEAARRDPDQQQLTVLDRGSQHPAAVVVHAAAQVDRSGSQLHRLGGGVRERADQCCGAAAFLGTLFQPEQPETLIRPFQQAGFLQPGQPADGVITGEWLPVCSRFHIAWFGPLNMLNQRSGVLGGKLCPVGPECRQGSGHHAGSQAGA